MDLQFPADLYYTAEHEWVRIDGDHAFVGITDFAQSELNEIVYVEVDSLNETLAKDEVFGTVEAVKTTSDLFMPLSGTIEAVNTELLEDEGDKPGLINDSPYGEGWIVKIKMTDPSELEELMSAEKYQDSLA